MAKCNWYLRRCHLRCCISPEFGIDYLT
jgi:hypothetical protein